MASLTVLKFSTSERAEEMPSKLQTLQNMHLIKNQEAAIVTWPVRYPIWDLHSNGQVPKDDPRSIKDVKRQKGRKA